MKIPQEGRVLILPPKEGACWYCGDEHDPKEPHNAASLLYQHRYRKRHGRYPTWEDAMAHCDRAVKKKWIRKLRRKGIATGGAEATPGTVPCEKADRLSSGERLRGQSPHGNDPKAGRPEKRDRSPHGNDPKAGSPDRRRPDRIQSETAKGEAGNGNDGR